MNIIRPSRQIKLTPTHSLNLRSPKDQQSALPIKYQIGVLIRGNQMGPNWVKLVQIGSYCNNTASLKLLTSSYTYNRLTHFLYPHRQAGIGLNRPKYNFFVLNMTGFPSNTIGFVHNVKNGVKLGKKLSKQLSLAQNFSKQF